MSLFLQSLPLWEYTCEKGNTLVCFYKSLINTQFFNPSRWRWKIKHYNLFYYYICYAYIGVYPYVCTDYTLLLLIIINLTVYNRPFLLLQKK